MQMDDLGGREIRIMGPKQFLGHPLIFIVFFFFSVMSRMKGIYVQQQGTGENKYWTHFLLKNIGLKHVY